MALALSLLRSLLRFFLFQLCIFRLELCNDLLLTHGSNLLVQVKGQALYSYPFIAKPYTHSRTSLGNDSKKFFIASGSLYFSTASLYLSNDALLAFSLSTQTAIASNSGFGLLNS